MLRLPEPPEPVIKFLEFINKFTGAISWISAHPLQSLLSVVFAIILVSVVLGIINQLVWQFVLLVWELLVNYFGMVKSQLELYLSKRAEKLQPTETDKQEALQKHLSETLDRLEILRNEQEVLVRQMRAILTEKKRAT